MIIECLKLTDFRIFQGHHTFDLTPKTDGWNKKNIVLFGGLNGAGKTSILLAIKLVLFGKQTLGYNKSQKTYEDFLAGCIHRTDDLLLKPFSSEIELKIKYASLGKLKNYSIKRTWMLNKNKIIESLTLIEDGVELSELNNDQCQGFLNEIIPIGIADLFFFDGEKIITLAEDKMGIALGDSIKRLLNLDLLEILENDLKNIIRNKSNALISTNKQDEISQLEQQLEKLEHLANSELLAFEQLMPTVAETQAKIDYLNKELSAKGGAWASARNEEEKEYSALTAQIKVLEANLREELASSYPLAIAANYTQRALTQLKQEHNLKIKEATNSLIQARLDNAYKNLSISFSKNEIEKIKNILLTELIDKVDIDVTITHDISESMLMLIETSINSAVDHTVTIIRLASQLKELRSTLSKIEKNIARTPDEDSLKTVLTAIQEENLKILQLRQRQKEHLHNYKQALREAIEVVSQLNKITKHIQGTTIASRTTTNATNSIHLLNAFKKQLTQQKITDLETVFANSFYRLARKGDMLFRTKINPQDFSVALVSEDGQEINKNELSAGEKQIYAIAILEALAKTSGRHLPIIIDTPLGRLDSIHRKHLLKEYFPNASHQVIILSTDTEINTQAYQHLRPYISKAYRLEYSFETHSTTSREGYFLDNYELIGDNNAA